VEEERGDFGTLGEICSLWQVIGITVLVHFLEGNPLLCASGYRTPRRTFVLVYYWWVAYALMHSLTENGEDCTTRD
jgi:hypothetical protein